MNTPLTGVPERAIPSSNSFPASTALADAFNSDHQPISVSSSNTSRCGRSPWSGAGQRGWSLVCHSAGSANYAYGKKARDGHHDGHQWRNGSADVEATCRCAASQGQQADHYKQALKNSSNISVVVSSWLKTCIAVTVNANEADAIASFSTTSRRDPCESNRYLLCDEATVIRVHFLVAWARAGLVTLRQTFVLFSQ